MPKQINEYQFGQRLVRLFGLKGRFQPVLDETIVPVCVVANTESEEIERGAMAGAEVAAVAAEFGYFRLANPLTSNLIFTVRGFRVTSSGGAVFKISCPGFALVLGSTAAAVTDWQDAGRVGSPGGAPTYGTHAAAVTGSWNALVSNSAANSIQSDMPIIIPPGSDCIWLLRTVNVGMEFALQWTERYATATLR